MGFGSQLLEILAIIMMFVNIVVIGFVVFLAYKMGTASDEGKRKEAKKRMFNALVSFVLIAILVGMLWGIDEIIDTTGSQGGNQITLQSPYRQIQSGGEEFSTIILDGDGNIATQAFLPATSNNPNALYARIEPYYSSAGVRLSTSLILAPGHVTTETQVIITVTQAGSFPTPITFVFTVVP